MPQQSVSAVFDGDQLGAGDLFGRGLGDDIEGQRIVYGADNQVRYRSLDLPSHSRSLPGSRCGLCFALATRFQIQNTAEPYSEILTMHW